MAPLNDRKGVYMVLVWRPVRKRSLGRPKRRWEDNNGYTGSEMVGMDLLDLAQDNNR